MTPKTLIMFLWNTVLAMSVSAHLFAQKSSPLRGLPEAIPFHLIAKLMVVEATAAGQKGLFIVDTGTPELILNEVWFKASKISTTIDDLTGHPTSLKTTYVPFSIGNLSVKKKRTFVADLRHIERSRKTTLLGIIGHSLLKNSEVLLDYSTKQIWLLPSSKKHKERFISPSPTDVLSFRMKGHLPFINCFIGKYQLRMILDTGAGINVLKPKWKEVFATNISNEKPTYVRSFNQQSVVATSALLADLYLSDIAFSPMRTFFCW